MDISVSTVSARTIGRNHYIDSARALFVLLGIPYHTALIYVPDYVWLSHSTETSPVFNWIVLALHTFRMPGFFLISGYLAATTMARKKKNEWLASRLVRIIVPLLVCSAILIPLQVYFEYLEAIKRGSGHDFTWLAHFQIYHLWFLVALLIMSLLFVAIWPFIQNIYGRVLENRSDHLKVLVFFIGAGLWKICIQSLDRFTGVKLQFFHSAIDVELALGYFQYFMIGALLWADVRLFNEVLKTRIWPIPVGCVAIYLYIRTYHPNDLSERMLHSVSGTVAALLCSLITLAICKRFFDSSSKAVTKVVSASFSIYLFHHPLIILMGTVATSLTLPPAIGYLGTIIIVFIISMGLHTAISENRWLMFAFNGVGRK